MITTIANHYIDRDGLPKGYMATAPQIAAYLTNNTQGYVEEVRYVPEPIPEAKPVYDRFFGNHRFRYSGEDAKEKGVELYSQAPDAKKLPERISHYKVEIGFEYIKFTHRNNPWK